MDITVLEYQKPAHRPRRRNQDHLDKDAERAAELGLSYGKYKALEREGKLPAGHLPIPTDEGGSEIPAPEPIILINGKRRYVRKDYPARPCEFCGKMYKPRAINSKYCCEDCRVQADRAKISAAKKARRESGMVAQA